MEFVIAVDGPAASGKGTVAGRLAQFYGLPYLDTGLLYRGVGVIAGEGADEQAAVAAAQALRPEHLDDPRLRTRAAGELASRVAVIAQVRAKLLAFQQRFAAQAGGAVLDGRDIGTVVAPSAPAKLFVTAAPEVRAERRWKQLLGQGEAGEPGGCAGRHPPARRPRQRPRLRAPCAGGGRRLARHIRNGYIPVRRGGPPHRRGGARPVGDIPPRLIPTHPSQDIQHGPRAFAASVPRLHA